MNTPNNMSQQKAAQTPKNFYAQSNLDELANTKPQAKKKPKRGVSKIVISSSLALTMVLGGAAYWAADRYLIPKVEVANASELVASNSTIAAANSSDEATEDAQITVTEHTTADGDTTYYVADVQLSSATQLQSAFANDEFGQNITQTVSEMAAANGASIAINGDYYGFRDSGIVIRNGVIYRDQGAREGLAIYADGSMRVYDETATTAQELVDDGVWQTLSFGPALVADGAVIDGIDEVEIDTNFGNHSVQGSHPRTAIGIIDDNHFVFVIVDGRSDSSAGATMTELAEIMVSLGVETAYNLDGGGSTTLYVNGEVINTPSNRGGSERGTSDILYISADNSTVSVQ